MKLHRFLSIVMIAAAALSGCVSGFGGRGHGPVEAFQFLTAKNPALTQGVDGAINEESDPAQIVLVVPPGTDVQHLVATLSLNVESVITVISSGNRVVQQNGQTPNDFSAPVLYSIEVAKTKTTWKYQVAVREAETNAALGGMAVAGASLQPSFSPRVKDYSVEVPFAAASVRVELRAQSPNAKSISVDGVAYPGASAGASVDFRSGDEKKVAIDALAEDGVTSESYTLVIRRGAPERNALLASLEIAEQPLAPAFTPSRNSYKAVVPYQARQFVLRAKAQSQYATLELATTMVSGRTTTRVPLASRGKASDASGATIDFTASDILPVIVTVKAQDGSVLEYLVEVSRAAPDRNNDLQLLEISGAGLNPAFRSGSVSYRTELPFMADKVTLFAKAQSAYGRIAVTAEPGSSRDPVPLITGDPASKAGAAVAFATDRLILTVAVTAQDGSEKRYVVEVRRGPPDHNANLQVIEVTGAVLSPAFNPALLSYTAETPYSGSRVTLFAKAQSVYAKLGLETAQGAGGAFVPVKGDPASKTGVELAFTVDRMTASIAVTAQDGSQKFYTVEVRRGLPDRNADLGSLSATPGILSPAFTPKAISYTVIVPASADTVKIAAAAASAVASVEVEGQNLTKASTQTATVAVPAGKLTSVSIFVTAEDGTQKLYRIQLSRDAAAPTKDSNARLGSLQVAGATLSPAFNPAILDYEAILGADAANPLVTAQAESAAASVTLDGQPLPASGVVVLVNPGATRAVVIDVTAESGVRARTNLKITRRGAGEPPQTGTDHVSVSIKNMKLAPREANSLAARMEKISYQARITVRTYRTSQTLLQEIVPVQVKGAGVNTFIDLSWRSAGISLDRNRMVEIEVGIQTDRGWLCYTEALDPSDGLDLNVPFLLYAADPRVAWPAVGQKVLVAGYYSLIKPGMSRSLDRQGVDRNDRNEYPVTVQFQDASSGKLLAESAVMIKGGQPGDYLYAFTGPVYLPEGAVIRYVLTAKLRNGEVWQASDTAEIWTTKPAYLGGFEPVRLRIMDELSARK